MTGIELALGGAFAFGVGGYLATILEIGTGNGIEWAKNRKRSKKLDQVEHTFEEMQAKMRESAVRELAQRVLELDDTHPVKQAYQDAVYEQSASGFQKLGRALAVDDVGEEWASRAIPRVLEQNGRDVVAEVERISTLSSVEDFMRGGE